MKWNNWQGLLGEVCSKAHAGINVNVELHVYWCEGVI